MPESTTESQKVIKKEAAYADSWEHIFDELKRLDLLIHLQLLKQRNLQTTNPLDQFKGLVLSEEEILRLLKNRNDGFNSNTFSSLDNPEIQKLKGALNHLESQIQEKKAASLKKGIYLSFPQLARSFNLTPFEEQCLLICLAPELDIKYEKLYAYLQDDITRKNPGVNMVVDLLCDSMEEKLSARLVFDKQSPLLKYKLLQMINDLPNDQIPLISRYLKVDDRIVNFLLGFNQIDNRLVSFTRLVPPTVNDQLALREYIQTRIGEFVCSHFSGTRSDRQNIVFHFYGPYGAGKRSLVHKVCRDLMIPLIIADIEKVFNGQLPFDDLTLLIGRETILQQAVLCIENFDYLLTDDRHQSQLRSLLEMIHTFSHLTFLTGSQLWKPMELLKGNFFINLEISIPDDSTRKQLWQSYLNKNQIAIEDMDLGELANKFRFTPGQIQNAITSAQNLARWHSTDNGQITKENLYVSCRSQSNSKLNTLARKIEPKYIWGDIVLPSDEMRQLHEICNHVKYSHIVYGEWGFDRKLSLGKGLNVLFSGPSGTGKTMAAEIIANELKLDMYKIDLSQVVSKYIGETEKNLNKIFTEAQTSNAILYFDEADALFGKRSEVKDAHDRYANIEIGYLLQKMEEYEGIVILATNLSKNIDDAFSRRTHFTIEFPFPDEIERELIWKKIFPRDAPLSNSIDYKFLAEKILLAGGNIKNIALAAAFYAADLSKKIRMKHIMLATKREYKKTGKAFLKADFEPYFNLAEHK